MEPFDNNMKMQFTLSKECVEAQDFLSAARNMIDVRADERDTEKERSMKRCVEAFWSMYGDGILRRGKMTETEGWMFMVLLKMSRSVAGYKEDDYIDGCAYFALGGESESQTQTSA